MRDSTSDPESKPGSTRSSRLLGVLELDGRRERAHWVDVRDVGVAQPTPHVQAGCACPSALACRGNDAVVLTR